VVKTLTVHIYDSARDSWLEVDGERVEGIIAVEAGEHREEEALTDTFAIIHAEGVTIIDERRPLTGRDLR
jgi:hypothetical protein